MTIAFDRNPKTPASNRWYFLKDDTIPTGQVLVEWWAEGSWDEEVNSHGRICMSALTGSSVGPEDMRQLAAAQRQATESGSPVMVMVYDRSNAGLDPVMQTINMMRDTIHSIGKNNGRIDPLSFSACSQAMTRLHDLMKEAEDTYGLLAQAYMDMENQEAS